MCALQSRVLVIRGGAIGDFILTLPAIRLIRENIPGSHLEVMGYPGIAGLAIKAGLANAVRSIEHRTMAPLFAKDAPIDDTLTEYLRSFHLVVSYLYDPDGHFRASLQRIGVKTLIECSHRVEPGKGHAAAQLARPLERLAMFLDDPAPQLFADRSPSAAAPLRIAIHPGSGSEKKNWPVEKWLQLARSIVAIMPSAQLHFVTGEAEAARGLTQPVREFAAALSIEIWHEVPLNELADRLAGCSVFLGHDSGISHLAAACGARCLLLFGPTDPGTWAPANPGVQVIQANNGDLAALNLETVQTVLFAMLGADPERQWPQRNATRTK